MTPAETGLVVTGYSIARRGQLRSCAEVVWSKYGHNGDDCSTPIRNVLNYASCRLNLISIRSQ